MAGRTKDIKTHGWLKEVNFNKMAQKVFHAPWKPTVNDPLDVSAFDNWDHMAKDEREKPLSKDEHKAFLPLQDVRFD